MKLNLPSRRLLLRSPLPPEEDLSSGFMIKCRAMIEVAPTVRGALLADGRVAPPARHQAHHPSAEPAKHERRYRRPRMTPLDHGTSRRQQIATWEPKYAHLPGKEGLRGRTNTLAACVPQKGLVSQLTPISNHGRKVEIAVYRRGNGGGKHLLNEKMQREPVLWTKGGYWASCRAAVYWNMR